MLDDETVRSFLPEAMFKESDATADLSPRAVVNFAAESHVDRSIHGPGEFIQTNIVGTFNLLESMRGHSASLHAFNCEDPHKETAAVIDRLSHYRYLYRRDGKLLDVKEVLAGRGLDTHISENSDILATDVAWNAAQ